MKQDTLRLIILAAVAAAIGVPPALAADIAFRPSPPPAAPTCVWCGWYAGLNAGGVWGSNDPTVIANTGGWFASFNDALISTAASQRFSNSGFTAGGQVGYNWQTGAVVYGLEADFEYFHPHGSNNVAGFFPASNNFQISETASADWLFTLRPRIGYSWNNWLAYATGGLAVSRVKFNETFASQSGGGPGAETASLAATKAGWVAGGGMEYALAKDWSARVEYLYVQVDRLSGSGAFCTLSCASNGTWSVQSGTFNENIVRGAINYRFN